MAEHEVKLTLKAKDEASKPIGATSKAAKEATESIKGATKATDDLGDEGKKAGNELADGMDKAADAAKNMEEKSESSLNTFAVGVTAANQAMELFGKAMGFVQAAFLDTIQASADFSREGSAHRQWAEDFAQSINRIKARIGDILIPIIQGLTGSMDGAAGGVAKWLEENRKLVASGILDFVESLGRTINGLVQSFTVVANAVRGFKVIFLAVGVAISEIVRGMIENIEWFVEKIRDVVAAIPGMGEQVKQLNTAIELLNASAGDFAGTSNDLVDDINATGTAMINATNNADKLSASVEGAFKKMVAGGREAIAASKASGDTLDSLRKEREDRATELANKAAEDAMAREEERKARLESSTEAFLAQRTLERDMQLKLDEDVAINQARLAEEREAQGAAMAQSMAEHMGTAFANIITGAETVGDAFKGLAKLIIQTIVQTAVKQITTNAAVAATEGAKATAGIPVVGPALAAGAAAAMSALVIGFLDKFASGGEVRGGVPGRDSVPALLTPGEIVLNPGESDLFRKLARSVSQPRPAGNTAAIPRFADGGTVASPMAMGGGVTINFSPVIELLDLPSAERRKRLLLGLGRDLEELVADGLLLNNLARA